MVSDMAPGLVKPLVWSTKYAPIVQNVFAPAFERIAGPTGIDHARLSTTFYSRVYMNVTAFGELFKRIGLPPNLFYVLSREDRVARRRPAIRLRMLPVLLRLGRFAWRESRIGRRVGAFLEAQHRRLDEFRAVDWAAQTPEALLDRFRCLKELHADSQRHIVMVSANMLMRSRMLGRMIARCRPETDPRDVIKGYGRRLGLMPFEEIKKLACAARGLDRRLLERIADGEEPEAAAALSKTEAGCSLVRSFEGFMARYGFLSANGSDFSEVPWIESPGLVWKSVARMALERDPVAAGRTEAHREQVLALVRSCLGPIKRRLFDRLHVSTVWFMDRRESLSLLMTEDSYLMRRCLLALGGKLVEQGIVAAPEDIFFLYAEELERLPGDAAETASAAAKIATRKAEMARHATLDPPETLCGDEAPSLEPPSAEGLDCLTGIGTSAGIVEGCARIVHDPALADGRYGRSDVLVVPFTDIGWTPILAGIGGIVAEAGGQLSHSSIIAREFGIPAVVSVRNATRLIRDGQTIKVDGSAGRVYLGSG
jgi:phosphohistidine swiveling domain-containing protein